MKVWSALAVAQSLIDAAQHLEMRDLAARRDIGKTKMSEEAKALFEKLREHILALDSNVLELADLNSVSYHGPEFFLEVLPRRYSLTLLLALDFNEVDDPSGRAQDAAQRTFFINARHEGGVSLSIRDADAITAAIPLVRQAHAASCG
jgi:predicted transport protein